MDLARTLVAVGREAARTGLVHSRVGNLSARVGDEMLISVRGAWLGRLRSQSLVRVPLCLDPLPPEASSDAPLHATLYALTDAGAILHTHSPSAVAVSLVLKTSCLRTEDVETQAVLGSIPLVDEPHQAALSEALRASPAFILRGHGVFALGPTPWDALANASFVEHACRVSCLVASLRAGPADSSPTTPPPTGPGGAGTPGDWPAGARARR